MATNKTRKTNANKGLIARTGRTVRDRPYASAAIATGAVTAVAAAAAGAFFFSRKDKSFRAAADDVAGRVKDGLAEAKTRFDYWKSGDKPQDQIAEEALTLKATGKKARRPADPMVKDRAKSGALAI